MIENKGTVILIDWLLNIQQQIFNAYSGWNSTFNAFSHPTDLAKKTWISHSAI